MAKRPQATTLIAGPADSLELYSLTEAAKRLGVSRTKLYDLVASGQLAYRRLGKDGARRIPHAELVRFINAGMVREQ